MDIKQPSATFPGFRHIHRTLMPGETIPRPQTLLEQLQALGGSAMNEVVVAEEEILEAAEDHDDEELV